MDVLPSARHVSRVRRLITALGKVISSRNQRSVVGEVRKWSPEPMSPQRSSASARPRPGCPAPGAGPCRRSRRRGPVFRGSGSSRIRAFPAPETTFTPARAAIMMPGDDSSPAWQSTTLAFRSARDNRAWASRGTGRSERRGRPPSPSRWRPWPSSRGACRTRRAIRRR